MILVSHSVTSVVEFYFHLLDLTHNILGILDKEQHLVVQYKYDAFGKVLEKTIEETELAQTLAEENIFLYKGYCYDDETGLFYCNSRYYNPEWGRFISPADVSALNLQSINGLNLYSYAGNNPINHYFISNDLNNSSSIQEPEYTNSRFAPPINHTLWNPHWTNTWFDTDVPSFFVFSNQKAALIDWGLSIYKGSLYFDQAENYSLYVFAGNISAYAGFNFEKNKAGIFVDANLVSFGYDGKYIDVEVSLVGVGFILGWEDSKFRFKFDPPGSFGFEISIDFGQIFKDWFGWEW
jgi:RHS repeat-associated protein